MAQVLDYSAGFPGAQAIRNAGYVGAVRYIGFPDRRKCTTAAELRDFTDHDLGMALVFENVTTDWRGGFSQGQASGRRARDHANAIGFPANRPIYMAVDQDVVTTGEFGLMIEYLRGAGTTIGGPYVTGVYGEADVCDRARDAGVAEWFWLTTAWSRGRRTPAHLFQHVGTVRVGGIDCDINDVLADDWGQHNAGRTDDMALTDKVTWWDGHQVTVSDILAELYIAARALAGKPPFGDTGPAAVSPPIEAIRAAVAGLSDDEAHVLAELQGARGAVLSAIAAIPPGGVPSQDQIDDLAAKLNARLGGTYQVTITRTTEGN